jgi:hypothetical protein
MMMMMMMTTTEMVLKTSVQYRHLTWLIARDDFMEFSRRESLRHTRAHTHTHTHTHTHICKRFY